MYIYTYTYIYVYISKIKFYIMQVLKYFKENENNGKIFLIYAQFKLCKAIKINLYMRK